MEKNQKINQNNQIKEEPKSLQHFFKNNIKQFDEVINLDNNNPKLNFITPYIIKKQILKSENNIINQIIKPPDYFTITNENFEIWEVRKYNKIKKKKFLLLIKKYFY